MKNIDRVREFHETYNCFINEDGDLENVTVDLALQRYNLISEELNELLNALLREDRVEILDALTDLEYVIDGTFLVFGVSGEDEYIEADRNVLVEQIKHGIETFRDVSDDPRYTLVILLHNVLYATIGACQSRDHLNVAQYCKFMKFWVEYAFDTYGFSDVREDAAIEVHRSNMSKLGEDGKPIYRESDGKVLKGANYFEPDLRQFVSDGTIKNARAS